MVFLFYLSYSNEPIRWPSNLMFSVHSRYTYIFSFSCFLSVLSNHTLLPSQNILDDKLFGHPSYTFNHLSCHLKDVTTFSGGSGLWKFGLPGFVYTLLSSRLASSLFWYWPPYFLSFGFDVCIYGFTLLALTSVALERAPFIAQTLLSRSGTPVLALHLY